MVRKMNLVLSATIVIFFDIFIISVDCSHNSDRETEGHHHDDIKILNANLNTTKVITVLTTQNLKLVKITHHHHRKLKCFKNVIGQFNEVQIKYLRGLVRRVTYVPMASSEYYNMVTVFVTGEAIGDVDVGTLCIRRIWNLEIKELNVFALNSKAVLTCQTKPTHRRSIHCASKADPSVTVQLSFAASDGISYAVVVGCLSNGYNFWFVASQSKTLTEDAKEQILDKVKELGFDVTRTLVASYDKCHSPPKSRSLKLDPPQVCFNESFDDYSILENFHDDDTFIPFASRRFFQQISHLLTGKSMEENNMEDACTWWPKVDGKSQSKSELKLSLKGFHGSAEVKCNSYSTNGIHGFHCTSKGYNNAELSWSSNPLLTDGENFILMGICLHPREHDWFVLARCEWETNNVDFKKKIHEKLLEIGFTQFTQNLNGIQVSYEYCKKKPQSCSTGITTTTEPSETSTPPPDETSTTDD